MTLVFDASVAVKWFMAEPDSPAAVAARASASRAIAPELIVAEILNASWLALRHQQLAPGQFHQVAATAPRYLDRLGHPVHDSFHLALAEREAASLVTADGRLKRRAAGSPWADLISDLAGFVPT